MREIGKQKRYKRIWIYLCFFIYVLILHIDMQMSGDDLHYFERAMRGIAYSSLEHYLSWSSRIIIEAVMMLILKHGFWLWKILDSLIWLLFVYSLCELFGDNRDEKDVIWSCVFVLLMPVSLLYGSTGWCATTTNYFWTSILGFYALVSIKKLWNEERIPLWHIWIYRLALLYAANLELVCGVLWITLLILYVLFKRKKKVTYKQVRTHFVLVTLELIFVLTCPGNNVRYAAEVNTWFPEYSNIGLLQKVSMGTGSTFYQMFYSKLAIMIVLCILVTVYLYNNCDRRKYIFSAIIPLMVCVLSGTDFLSFTSTEGIRSLQGGFIDGSLSMIYQFGSITADNYMRLVSWIPLGISAALFLSLSFALAVNILLGERSYVEIYMFLTGFGSRCVMSFTPTIWASAYRSFIPFYCMLIGCCFLIYLRIKQENFKGQGVLLGICMAISLNNGISFLLTSG